jgi:hypothetical protein
MGALSAPRDEIRGPRSCSSLSTYRGAEFRDRNKKEAPPSWINFPGVLPEIMIYTPHAFV